MLLTKREDFKLCKVGDNVTFKQRSMIEPNRFYDGVIIKKFSNHFVVNAVPKIPEKEQIWGKPKPYNVSISETQIGAEGLTIYLGGANYDKETEEKTG